MDKKDELYFIEKSLKREYQRRYSKQKINQNDIHITYPYHIKYIHYKYLTYIIKNILQI